MKRLFFCFILLPLLGCSPAATVTKTPVNEADFGTIWPLTVSKGTIETYEEKGSQGYRQIEVRFVTEDGQTYGLNGTAQTHGYSDIHAVTKTRTGAAGGTLYEEVDSLISRGLSAHYEKDKKP